MDSPCEVMASITPSVNPYPASLCCSCGTSFITAMPRVLLSSSTQGAGWRELGAVESKHTLETCLCNTGPSTGWEGKLVPFGLRILLRGMTEVCCKSLWRFGPENHLGWVTGKTSRLWAGTKTSVEQYKNYLNFFIIICHEEKENTSSKGNFTGMIALTQAAGSKGGASPGKCVWRHWQDTPGKIKTKNPSELSSITVVSIAAGDNKVPTLILQ